MAKKEKKLVTANMPAPQVLVTQAAADHQSPAESPVGARPHPPLWAGGRLLNGPEDKEQADTLASPLMISFF